MLWPTSTAPSPASTTDSLDRSRIQRPSLDVRSCVGTTSSTMPPHGSIDQRTVTLVNLRRTRSVTNDRVLRLASAVTIGEYATTTSTRRSKMNPDDILRQDRRGDAQHASAGPTSWFRSDPYLLSRLLPHNRTPRPNSVEELLADFERRQSKPSPYHQENDERPSWWPKPKSATEILEEFQRSRSGPRTLRNGGGATRHPPAVSARTSSPTCRHRILLHPAASPSGLSA
jgi:hypothetical protein